MPIDPVSVFLALTAAAIFAEDDQEQRRAIAFVTSRANEAGPSWVDALDRRFALVDIVFDDLWLEEAGSRGDEVGAGWGRAISVLGEDQTKELFRRLLDRYRLTGIRMTTGEEDEPSPPSRQALIAHQVRERDFVEGDAVRIDTRQRYLDQPMLAEAVFVMWEVHPMWEGKRPNPSCPAPAVVRSQTPLRAPTLEVLGDGLYRVRSEDLYPLPPDALGIEALDMPDKPGEAYTEKDIENVLDDAKDANVVERAIRAMLLAGVPASHIFVWKNLIRHRKLLLGDGTGPGGIFEHTIFDLLPTSWQNALDEALAKDAAHDAEIIRNILLRWGIDIGGPRTEDDE